MAKTYKLYRVTNRVNGKAYIGVTTLKPEHRLSAHGCHGAMKDDIEKYGRGSFDVKVIDQFISKESALSAEAEAILREGTHEPAGYNRQVRGGSYPGRGGAPKGNSNASRQPVIQLDQHGNTVATFGSVMEAAAALGINRRGIQRATNNPEYTAGGFYWKKG